MRRIVPVFLTACFLAFGATAVEAQDRDRRGGQEAAPTERFSAQERELIAAYFTRNRTQVQSLPPGIARNLARGKPLPPGIAKRALPATLSAQLPERAGFEVTIFGDRIVLLEASGLVVDVLEGILR